MRRRDTLNRIPERVGDVQSDGSKSVSHIPETMECCFRHRERRRFHLYRSRARDRESYGYAREGSDRIGRATNTTPRRDRPTTARVPMHEKMQEI